MKSKIYIYDLKSHARNDELISSLAPYTNSSEAKLKNLFSCRNCIFIRPRSEDDQSKIVELLTKYMLDFDLEAGELDDDKKNWLLGEVTKWIKRKILPLSYATAILSSYGLVDSHQFETAINKTGPKRSLKKILLIFGALLVGLGLILFIAANWKKIPYSLKFYVSVAASMSFLYAAYQAKIKKLSHLLHLHSILAFFSAGASICLVGQNYNIISDHYSMPLLWSVLIFLASYALKYKPGYFAATALVFLANLLSFKVFEMQLWFYPLILIVTIFLTYKKDNYRSLFGLNYIFALLFMIFAIMSDQIILWSLIAAPVIFLAVDEENDLNPLGANCALLLSLLVSFGSNEIMTQAIVFATILLLMLLKKNLQTDIFALLGLSIFNLAFINEYNFPNIFYLLPLSIFIVKAWKFKSSTLAILTVMNFIYWIFVFYSQIIDKYNLVQASILDIGFFVLAIASVWTQVSFTIENEENYMGFKDFLKCVGMGILGLIGYCFSYHAYKADAVFHTNPLFSWSSLILFSLSAFILILNYSKKRIDYSVSVFNALLIMSYFLSNFTQPISYALSAAFNLSLFAGALLLVMKGHKERNLGLNNAGVSLFVLLLVTRYFDTFSALLSRSIFFISIGLGMIAWVLLSDHLKRKFKKSELSHENR